MSWLERLFGAGEGDRRWGLRRRSSLAYLLGVACRSLARLLANHCLIPSLRVALFRLSGVVIGRRVRVNLNTMFLDEFRPGLIVIEDRASLAPGVSLVAVSQPNESPLAEVPGLARSGQVTVRSGAWLGVGSVVLPGVTVGRQAVVGAGAVVTKDVEDFAIVAGVPARKVGDVRELAPSADHRRPNA